MQEKPADGLSSFFLPQGYGLLCVGYSLSDLELETQDEDAVRIVGFIINDVVAEVAAGPHRSPYSIGEM